MKKVYQTKFGKEGNCFVACLASILELNIEDIPDFRDVDKWYFDYKRWLLKKFDLDLLALEGWGKRTIGFAPKVYAVVSGLSPRGFQHSTIYFGNEMVHDPHMDGGGVTDITDWIYIVSVFPKTK